ncbi:FadR/GntR family transcriptional regulator [Acidimangrovimonas pyrenivorans]|uniref:FadR/GntR family transcriptional regulator n=1 Tax=Acidimangrovimonas pyrenivorans TaxID=2030798 RepID=A0ABV7AKT6_9RHOB
MTKSETGEGRAGRRSDRRNLVESVREGLRAEILSDAMKAGDKLPSEAQLTERFGVSRTVVREAIASLRADGLVAARQGAGVFVLERKPSPAQPFQAVDPERISHMIEMLELRATVEIEAARLAAIRRSPAQEEEILQRMHVIEALIEQGAPTTEADFAFHMAIAEATNNPRFAEFLRLMGASMIPRAALQKDRAEASSPAYLAHIADEHRAIAEAISNRDEQAASQAMRTHLKGSEQRYRELLRQARTTYHTSC